MSHNPGGVVVTGVGPVSSIGLGAEAFWAALLAGHSGAQPHVLPFDLGRTSDLTIAAMPPADEIPELAAYWEFLSDQECGAYRDLAYALLAVELSLDDAGLNGDEQRGGIGVVQAFEAPGVERTVAALFELMSGPLPENGPPPVYDMLAPYFYRMQPFLYVHLMGKAMGLHGFSTSVHNACASGAVALDVAADRIRTGQADVMVVAGGEAFDTAVRLEWFQRLEMYATGGQMRPFDAQASGFFVGEGAAALVLESGRHAADRGARVYAEYLGGCFAQQSWKQTVPDVRSARLADVTADALQGRGVTPEQLDLIVPHGAATQIGDGYEATCLEQALAGKAGAAVATAFKPHVGHLLAASPLIEMVAALLALEHQTVPATLHTDPQRNRLSVPLVTETVERPIRTLLKLTTGFTGHDAAQLFRRA